MKSGIYKITCLKNKKIYIGSSNDCIQRYSKHIWALKNNKHHNKYLQSAFLKYGEENFEFEIIESVEENSLLEREQFYLDFYKPYDRTIGYNICDKAENGKSKCFDDSKDYIIVSPNGQKFIINNLARFCRNNNISESGLRSVALHRLYQSRGWHCRYANESVEEWHSKLKRRRKSGICEEFFTWIFTMKDGSKLEFISLIEAAKFFKIPYNRTASFHAFMTGRLKNLKYVPNILKIERNFKKDEDYLKWK